jgi:hypothetical protein
VSERSRARIQFLLNRLEELDARLGYDRGPPQESIECDPSWGPVGSFARACLPPGEYERLVRIDAEIAAMGRARRPAPTDGSTDVQEEDRNTPRVADW